MRQIIKNRLLKKGVVFIVLFGLCMIFLFGLGMLRFHAARLAYHLESLNRSIQKYADEEATLKQELSALVAPIKIYSYCKEHLGMQKVSRAETLPIRWQGERVAMRHTPTEKQGWRASLAWLFGK